MNLSLDDLLRSLDSDAGVEKAASTTDNIPGTAAVATVAASAADELEQTLTKKANENEVTTQMANVSEKGKAIADSILALVKQAADGLAPTAPENRLIAETAAQVAQSTAGTAEIPGGTMTQVLQGLVANSAANGAIRDEALAENAAGNGDETNAAQPQPSSDGSVLAAVAAGGAPEMADEVEKVAAVVTLVDNGYDFSTAVAMVKAAEEEILAEEFEQVKIAAVNELMAEGIDLESAVILVKEAASNKAVQILSDAAKDFSRQARNVKVKTPASAKTPGAVESAKSWANDTFNVSKRLKAGKGDLNDELGLIRAQAKEDAAFRGVSAAAGPATMGDRAQAVLDAVKNKAAVGGAYAKHYGKAAGPAALAGGAVLAGGAAAMSGNEKKAAAIETLVAHGYTVAEALDILG